MSNLHELTALAKDCYFVLHRARRIDYVGGDGWQLEKGEVEHPLVPRLRVVSMLSITNDPPMDTVDRDETSHLLRSERGANDKMRIFLRRLEDMCLKKGMKQGTDVLEWLEAAIP
jgi:hypothetical protein